MSKYSEYEGYRRPVQAPAEKAGYHEEKVFTHPSFGQISANRVSGGAVLYGSDFHHDGYVSITIKRSELHRNLAHDWPMGREELITVNLSEAQWARFVSAMNIGDGPQCTIEHVQMERMPGLPNPVDRRAQFAGESDETAARVKLELAGLREDIAASGLSAKKAKPLLDRIHQAEMAAGVNQEYVAEQFERHMEKTVERARIEVDAHVQAAITHAGLRAIAIGAAEPAASFSLGFPLASAGAIESTSSQESQQ